MIFTWAKIALAVLGIVQWGLRRAERAGAIAEGDRQAIARMTREIEKEAGIAREIDTETASMTPDQVLQDLEQRGELRD